jgi:predicted GTPase
MSRRQPDGGAIKASSPVTLDPGPTLTGLRVLVVEDGPTVTHGGMPFGTGTVAARHADAGELMHPRPYAVGSIAETFARYPHIGALVPAMGYGKRQIDELEATIAATPCDVVVTGRRSTCAASCTLPSPVRHATYELREIRRPTLADVLAPLIQRVRPDLR